MAGELRFEWDGAKVLANVAKHGVRFEEAATVFLDPLARMFWDEDHSLEEEREIIVGHSVRNRLLLVSFTERAANVIRIIAARPATKSEREDYEKNRK